MAHPLDIGRPSGVSLDGSGDLDERAHLLGRQDRFAAQVLRDRDEGHALLVPHGHDLLVRDLLTHPRSGGGVDDEVIGDHLSSDEGFAKAPGGIDDDVVAPPADRVGRE